jgi:hypothetical protein
MKIRVKTFLERPMPSPFLERDQRFVVVAAEYSSKSLLPLSFEVGIIIERLGIHVVAAIIDPISEDIHLVVETAKDAVALKLAFGEHCISPHISSFPRPEPPR